MLVQGLPIKLCRQLRKRHQTNIVRATKESRTHFIRPKRPLLRKSKSKNSRVISLKFRLEKYLHQCQLLMKSRTTVNSPHHWLMIRQKRSLTQDLLSHLESKCGNKTRKKTVQRLITFLSWLMTTKSSQFHPYSASKIKMQPMSLNIK